MKNFPVFNWAFDYKKEYLQGDIIAGLTVGIMLIPQGMAYALLAGLPPVYGLYASLVPIIVYAMFGTSRQLAVGPVAMDSLLVASFVSTLAEIGTENYLTLAFMLATLMGAIQLLLGLFKMGFLVNFLSKPVISGFTSAAALIIGLSQLKHLLGANIPRSNQIQYLAINVWNNISSVHSITVIIGIFSILIIMGIKKFANKIPAPLVVVVFGTLVVWLFGLDHSGVNIVSTVPQGLPSFQLPVFELELIQKMLPMAATIALVAFMEAISVAKTMQTKHKDYELIPNRELIALGSANFIGSFFQAYPTTGGFSRTAVNDQAGAKTPFASIISATLITLTLLFLTPLFYYLPNSVLASIIMVAVFGLIDFKYPIELWKGRRIEFYMLIITFIITLTVGITNGIATGVVLSLLVMIYLSTKPHIAILGKIKGSNQFRNVTRFEDLEIRNDILITRFDAQMYFANAQYLKDSMNEMVQKKGADLKLVILNMESVNIIDSSAIVTLEELVSDFNKKNIKMFFSGTIGPVRDILNKFNFIEKLGKENFYLDIQSAIDYYDSKQENNYLKNKATQYNKD